MKRNDLEQTYLFLKCHLWYLQERCYNCGYHECAKNGMKPLLLPKYRRINEIDHKYCLERTAKEIHELKNILQRPEFRKWSYEECLMCHKKFFGEDMPFHIETEKNPKKGENVKVESFKLCDNCHKQYSHRKIALYEGYKKTL